MLGTEGLFSHSAEVHTCSCSSLCFRSATSLSKRSPPDGGRSVWRRLGAGAEADGPLFFSLKYIGVGTRTVLGSANIFARCCQKHRHVTDSIQR